MDFMHGPAATPANKAAFLELQDPNLSHVLARYSRLAAKRAEFTRRFPSNQSLHDLMLAAVNQGATDEELKAAGDYIDVMMGSYGLTLSPAFEKLFTAFDQIRGKTYATPEEAQKTARERAAKMRQYSGYLVVYQNLRNLALATLSSLVDPLGVGIRSGEFHEAYLSMRDSFRALRKDSPSDFRKLAEDLGVIESSLSASLLATAYGGIYLTQGAAKVSDVFFRLNGLNQWTEATRVAALASGMRFLIRHSAGRTETSKRYLSELGLSAGDVRADSNGRVELLSEIERQAMAQDPDAADELARDTRVRNALVRFVDEAILRPNPSQRPLWASDPNYMLISQYKSFVYAFQATILKRIKRELDHGNFKVLLVAAAYTPIMLVAELFRELLQHGPEGDERRENWGVTDYMTHAYKRTGMLGTDEFFVDASTDLNYGRLPGASFLGPTIAHARDFDGDKPAKRVVVEALPGSSLYEDW
jgi:hypothetical protein